jgi:N,N-dimethylformamidase
MTRAYVLDLLTSVTQDPAVSRDVDRRTKTIVGYCWPWTARPGETIEFKVSAFEEGEYRADLVRIICGDNFSDPARYQEEPLAAAFAGSYPGQFQRTYPGSLIQIPACSRLDALDSFTVQTFLYPTRFPASTATPKSEACEQHLISRWDRKLRQGWALLIDVRNRLAFRVGGPSGVQEIATVAPLAEHLWYLAIASYDATRRHIRLTLESRARSPATRAAKRTQYAEALLPPEFALPQTGPLCFAGCADAGATLAETQPGFCFNGRLDRVRLCAGIVSTAVADALGAPGLATLPAPVVGFWDFAADIGGTRIKDCSGNELHGVIVNAPLRAVAGIDWNGSAQDWRHAPQHYSAIHFHDDDLYDAQWRTAFSFQVPDDLPSGVYAARLRQGDSEDYIPCFVAPPRGEARSVVAVLLPTASYTAYANVTSILTYRAKTLIETPDGGLRIDIHTVGEKTISCDPVHLTFLLKHGRDLGAGVYARHSDGSMRTSASQKHPNLSVRPKGMNWTLVADTYLIDWLEHKKIEYDILTDDLLHAEGADLLKQYRVVLTGNHPEYYSRPMWDAVSEHQRCGGRWMYLGGNGFFWVTSFHRELPGLIEVRKTPDVARHELVHAADGVSGGKWRDVGFPPQCLVGIGMSADNLSSACPYQRLPGSYDPRAAFIFDGVEKELIGDFGLIGGGAAGQEVDRIGFELGTPPHALHLARAERLYRITSVAGEQEAAIADLVFFEGPRGGAVFSVGSMAWVGALSHNHYDNEVSRITENVLRRFMDAAPIALPADTPHEAWGSGARAQKRPACRDR